MPEQDLDHADIDSFCSSKCVAKEWRSVCIETRLINLGKVLARAMAGAVELASR